MVLGRAVRAGGCASCRISILKNFTSLTQPLTRPPAISASPSTALRTRHSRHTSSTAYATPHTDISGATIQTESPHNNTPPDVEEGAAPTETIDLPWYLRLNSPKKEPLPLSERQRIPDLPETSPPILQPLMQHVSVDLGLDDLTLLDLRKLDPPPALGANLMMLLGTTRSEKHLHVSADRLCRWLRSKYKLRPDADGLLGRNELKLKLKRKNRKAKLMGNSTADNDDDGVRTGWVCVDVGVVESPEGDQVDVPDPGFVGFGRRTDGIRIVVQMLTEEKREEINLEQLWGGILKRGLQGGLEVDGTEPHSDVMTRAADEASMISQVCKPSSSLLGPFTQARRIHTTPQRMNPTKNHSVHKDLPFYADEKVVTKPPLLESLINEMDLSLTLALDAQQFQALHSAIEPYISRIPELQVNGWRGFLLRKLRLHLERMEPEVALQHLGSGYSDYSSTPFLAGFYGILSPFQSQDEFEARLWLQCFARQLGNTQGYTHNGLMALFEEIQLAGVGISTVAYKRLLFSILCPTKVSGIFEGPTNNKVNRAMKVLKAMHAQGIDILNEDVLVLLQEASYQTVDRITPEDLHASPGSLNFPSLPPNPVQRRLHLLMQKLDLPPFSEESRLRLLDLHASQNHWREFWDIWRMGPRHGLPHSEAMYRCMFDAVAQTKNQSACCTALRTWIPEMDRESVLVDISWQLVAAIMKCVQIADPDVVTTYYNDPEGIGEWLSLWRRCVRWLEDLENVPEELDVAGVTNGGSASI